MTRLMNFNAGPATLPDEALARARDELLDFEGTGLSIMEHSHRGPAYEAVHEEALGLVRALWQLPATHDVLFLQGGASQQFAQVPLNFLPPDRRAGYVVNGAWGEKAFAEAKTVRAVGGGVAVLAHTTGTGDGRDPQYARVSNPEEIQEDPSLAYLHVTSNETIHGLQYEAPGGVALPAPAGVPLVVDHSSDFGWRPADLARFDLVYAGAQKNIGPSGLVVVVARKAFLAEGRRDLPKVFQYRTAAAANSLYNTPPTFSVYLVRNVLGWTRDQGGLAAMERRNLAKAALVYGALDRNPGFWHVPVEKPSRSVMNVVFRLPSEALEDRFVAEAAQAGMVGLKGHRSVGGIRVSLYNAIPEAWAQVLAGFMDDFVRRYG